MQTDLRFPNITGGTPEAQLQQMQSYMHQLVEQLNFAMNTITAAENGDASKVRTEGGDGVSLSSKDAAKTFNSIKGLIISSADIITAYEKQITDDFNGHYFADSDFGQYIRDTNKRIETNSKNTTELYKDIQQIVPKVEGIENYVSETQAWTRSGLLDEGEGSVPIYGFEVGQKTVVGDKEVFNKYSRFTADGIFFYLPGAEDPVAHFTGTELVITNIRISGNMYLSGFVFDTSDGIAIRWSGGM